MPRRASRSPLRLEEQHQRAVVERAAWTPVPNGPGKVGDFLIHPANGGLRSKTEAAIFKALGVRAGVSDLLLALPRGPYAGLWIEMKKAAGEYRCPREAETAASPAQKIWLVKMAAVGYCAAIAYGADAAWTAIEEYLVLPPAAIGWAPRVLRYGLEESV